MDNKKAVRVLQGYLMGNISILKEQDREWATAIDEAWKVIRKTALEAENRPHDASYSTPRVNVSTEEESTETERLAKRTINMVEELWDKITRLQGNLCQLERTVTYHDVLINGIMRKIK